ncbi:hypothetical protein [Streptomyces sp. NPDC056401]
MGFANSSYATFTNRVTVQFLAELCDGPLEPWALPQVSPQVTDLS